jgi:pimeloyl-ACP methyl ester carboxylesterase
VTITASQNRDGLTNHCSTEKLAWYWRNPCCFEIDRPWDAYTDDQLGVMDHLGIDKFMVMGFCIGGPFTWNLLKRAPDRIVAAVLVQPSGFRPEMPNLSYEGNMTGWGPELVKRWRRSTSF